MGARNAQRGGCPERARIARSVVLALRFVVLNDECQACRRVRSRRGEAVRRRGEPEEDDGVRMDGLNALYYVRVSIRRAPLAEGYVHA